MTLRFSNERTYLQLFQKFILLTQVCLRSYYVTPLFAASIKQSDFLTIEAVWSVVPPPPPMCDLYLVATIAGGSCDFCDDVDVAGAITAAFLPLSHLLRDTVLFR